MFEHTERFEEKLAWNCIRDAMSEGRDLDEEYEDEEEFEGETVAEFLARHWDWTKTDWTNTGLL